MNEKMERVVIEPGQTVEYLPGQTFVLLSDTKMQFKTASKFITQEDVVKNDVESKNTKVNDIVSYKIGTSIEVRDKVTFKFLENDTNIVTNGEDSLAKKEISLNFVKGDIIIFQQDATIEYESDVLVSITVPRIEVVKKVL